MPSTLSGVALDVARSYLGTRESGGNNRGPEVEAFLASVGLAPGFPWCAAFVHFCFRQAAAKLGLVNPCPGVAAAVKLWKLADPACHDANPSVGAIYVLQHDAAKGTGHAGIVESVGEDGAITEISGNTNRDGSREGDSVWRHVGQPEVTHGGVLLGYVVLDRAAQSAAPAVT